MAVQLRSNSSVINICLKNVGSGFRYSDSSHFFAFSMHVYAGSIRKKLNVCHCKITNFLSSHSACIHKTQNRPVSETLAISANKVTLAYTPVDPEDITIRVISDDDPIGTLYEYDSTAGAGKFSVSGKVVSFASGTTGTALVNYEKAMTKGAVVEAKTDTEYPIRELHVYIKVKDVCTDETFSGVWVFYRVQKDVTSIDIDFAIDGKPSQSWTTMSNSLCNAADKTMAAFFIDFEAEA